MNELDWDGDADAQHRIDIPLGKSVILVITSVVSDRPDFVFVNRAEAFLIDNRSVGDELRLDLVPFRFSRTNRNSRAGDPFFQNQVVLHIDCP